MRTSRISSVLHVDIRLLNKPYVWMHSTRLWPLFPHQSPPPWTQYCGITSSLHSCFKSLLPDRVHDIFIYNCKWYTIAVVSPKARCSVPCCSFCTCCPSVTSHAAMDSNFSATLMIPGFIHPQKSSLLPLSPPSQIPSLMNNNLLELIVNKSGPQTPLPIFPRLLTHTDSHAVLPPARCETPASSWIPLSPTRTSPQRHSSTSVTAHGFVPPSPHLLQKRSLTSSQPPDWTTAITTAMTSSPTYLLKLQCQNSAATLFTHFQKPHHTQPSTPTLPPDPTSHSFQHLLHDPAPSYLTDFHRRHSPTRLLRESDANLLTPITRTPRHCTLEDRALAKPSGTLSLQKFATQTHSTQLSSNL